MEAGQTDVEVSEDFTGNPLDGMGFGWRGRLIAHGGVNVEVEVIGFPHHAAFVGGDV